MAENDIRDGLGPEERRSRRAERRRIVRDYLDTLDDGVLAKVCYLYTRGLGDADVMRELGLEPHALAQIKTQIAEGLVCAGIEAGK